MAKFREMVIKIPEEIISFVNLNGFLPENYRSAMGRVLLDGVELPKGHGRLIDADALPLNDIDDANYGSNYIHIAPTIVEAEKENE